MKDEIQATIKAALRHATTGDLRLAKALCVAAACDIEDYMEENNKPKPTKFRKGKTHIKAEDRPYLQSRAHKLWKEHGNYSAVARIMQLSNSTVGRLCREYEASDATPGRGKNA